MRHRVEDLGRLTVLISNLLDHQLFGDSLRPRRAKDFLDWFSELSEDRKEEVLRAWAYGIEEMKDRLYEMLEIAEGTDLLNENKNECAGP